MMTDLTKRLSVFILASTYFLAGTVALAESVDVKRQNDEFIARGGVIVTALTGTAVAGVFAGGFQSIAKERSKDAKISYGTVKAPSSPLSQQIMAGTRPGDILKYEFIPSSAQALTNATEDLTQAVARWTEQIRDLEFERGNIKNEIDAVKSDYAGRASDSVPPKLSAAAKAQRIADLENDLADNLKLEKTAHTKLGEMNAQRLTALGQKAFTERTGTLSSDNHVVIEVPVLKNLSTNPDSTITRMLALDESVKSTTTPAVRIYKTTMKATNMAARTMKSARRGLVGVAAGVAIMVEEIAVGEIGKKLSEESTQHYMPELRIEPKGVVQ